MIGSKVSARILTISQEYRNPKGGIGSVVNTYKSHFEVFKHISTYPNEKVKSKVLAIPFYILSICKFIVKLFFDREISIIHIHTAARGSFLRNLGIFIIAKYIYDKKVILHAHGSEMKKFYDAGRGWTKRIFKFFISNVDVLIVLSIEWKEFYQSFQPKRIVILENIVERPIRIKSENLDKKHVIKFLFLGFLGDRKGVFDLLEMIIQNVEKLKNKCKFYIAGNGDSEKLLNILKTNQINNLVDYQGWVSGENKFELLSKCDVFVLPSYNEGLPIAILEAMSYQMPIISTNVGGIPEVVKNEKNGYLINPGDISALFTYIYKFIENHNLINQMGSVSGKLVTPYYSDEVMRKLQGIYESVLTIK